MAIETNKAVVPSDYTKFIVAEAYLSLSDTSSKSHSINYDTSIQNYPFDMVYEREFSYAPLEETISRIGQINDNGISKRYVVHMDINNACVNNYRFFRFIITPNIKINVDYTYPAGSYVSAFLHLIISVNSTVMKEMDVEFGYTKSLGANWNTKKIKSETYSLIYDPMLNNLIDDTANGTDRWGGTF